MAELRVIDFGRVSALRSQTLWHAIAYGVSAGSPPTLSFARPADPYVCVGFHRSLEEVDEEYCAAHGLPVYRRMVGGGPVYLDDNQLFFQICLPAGAVSPSRLEALRDLLVPAATAFRAVGVDAELDADLEIVVGDRKICGHGAGQVEDAVVVCGNLIQGFDHERATRVLRLPDADMRAETLRLMRRYVAATPVDDDAFRDAMVEAYADALGLRPVPGELTAIEKTTLAGLDGRFTSREWIAGPEHTLRRRPRQVKVRAGVWVFAADCDRARVMASVVRGTVERARLSVRMPTSGPHAADPGERPRRPEPVELFAAEQAVSGVALAQVPQVLAGFGTPGRQLAAVFAAADGKRL